MARRWFDLDKLMEWLADNVAVHSESGDEIVVDCPSCGSPKLWINQKSGQIVCYRCEFGGSLYDLVEEVEGVERSEARKILGVDKSAEQLEQADEAAQLFPEPRQVVASGPPVADFPECLPEGVKWFGFSMASCQAEAEMAGQALAALGARGFPPEFVVAQRAGWCWRGRWKDRVILPVFRNGKCVWWQAWDCFKKFGKLKYHNPSNEEVPYRRNELVYNIEKYPAAESLVLCEGIFNCWALEQVGKAAVCMFGKTISDNQREQLLAHPAKKLFLGFDDDARNKAADAQRMFRGFGKEAVLCTLPTGRDFNDLGQQDRLAVLETAGEPDWLFDR